jgi:hypothetical protein
MFNREVAHDIFRRLKIHNNTASVQGASVTAFDVEVLYIAVRSGYRIKEVPVDWFYGQHSKVNPLMDSMLMFRDITRVRWNAWRGMYED